MITPGAIKYLGSRPTLVRGANGQPQPGYELLFSLPDGEVHSAVVAREGFSKEVGEAAILAAAAPFLELANLFPGG